VGPSVSHDHHSESGDRWGAKGFAAGSIVGFVIGVGLTVYVVAVAPDFFGGVAEGDGRQGRERGLAMVIAFLMPLFAPMLALGGVGWVIGYTVGLSKGTLEDRRRLLKNVVAVVVFVLVMALTMFFIIPRQ